MPPGAYSGTQVYHLVLGTKWTPTAPKYSPACPNMCPLGTKMAERVPKCPPACPKEPKFPLTSPNMHSGPKMPAHMPK